MCGIVGFVDFRKKSSKEILQNMTDVLRHQGPDDSGYAFYNELKIQIGLGHRRLSILDLSKHGHQPMLFENLEIVYKSILMILLSSVLSEVYDYEIYEDKVI